MKKSSGIKKIVAVMFLITIGIVLTACTKNTVTNNSSDSETPEYGKYSIYLSTEETEDAFLSWSDCGAENYDVLIAFSETMEKPYVIETEETKISTREYEFLESDVTYYWKVIGNNQDSQGGFSKTGSFTITDTGVITHGNLEE